MGFGQIGGKFRKGMKVAAKGVGQAFETWADVAVPTERGKIQDRKRHQKYIDEANRRNRR